MKHYIYIDQEILNSYISQIYGGIIERERSETESSKNNAEEISNPEEKIKATVTGGIKGLLTGSIETEYDTKDNVTERRENYTASKEVIEKIYHDNLLDNLINYITEKEEIVNDIERVEYGRFVKLGVPFNFANHSYLEAISNEKFKKAYEKITNILTPGNEKEVKDAKKAMELIGNFTTFFESAFPVSQLIIHENLIIPIDNKFLRENPNIIDFKYGGKIVIIGKVTKDCSKAESIFGLYNKEFGKAIEEIKGSMYNIFLPKYKESFIITPIALYFE